MSDAPKIAVAALSHSPLMTRDRDHLEGVVFREGLARLRKAIEEFAPTLVVCFGPDHERALSSIKPCFTIVESAVGVAEWDLPEEAYDVPVDTAQALTDYLAERGLDVAVGSDLGLDHGFGLTIKDVFGSLAVVPTIPILINCVGRPLASTARTAALGKAVRQFLQALPADERILVLGSGGISHTPPTQPEGAEEMSEGERQRILMEQLAGAADFINPEWDLGFMGDLARGDWERLGSLTKEDLVPAGTGGAEVRTWIAAAFAGGVPLENVAYEPVDEWITGMGISASANLAATVG